jgi:hypothetical protein
MSCTNCQFEFQKKAVLDVRLKYTPPSKSAIQTPTSPPRVQLSKPRSHARHHTRALSRTSKVRHSPTGAETNLQASQPVSQSASCTCQAKPSLLCACLLSQSLVDIDRSSRCSFHSCKLCPRVQHANRTRRLACLHIFKYMSLPLLANSSKFI